ncbi:MAG: hypothetical protein ACLGJC_16295 [Alphaproteobacteria bacterium]
MVEAAEALEAMLKAAGVGSVVGVRDILRGERLFRRIDPGNVKADVF